MNVFAQKKCVICHIDVKWIHLKNPYLYENKNVFDNDDSCSITINLDHYFMILYCRDVGSYDHFEDIL